MRRIAVALLVVGLTAGCGGDPSAGNTADVPDKSALDDLVAPLATAEPVTVPEACAEYLDGAGRGRLHTLATRLDTDAAAAQDFANLAAALGQQARFRRRDAADITLEAVAEAVVEARADVDALCEA